MIVTDIVALISVVLIKWTIEKCNFLSAGAFLALLLYAISKSIDNDNDNGKSTSFIYENS